MQRPDEAAAGSDRVYVVLVTHVGHWVHDGGYPVAGFLATTDGVRLVEEVPQADGLHKWRQTIIRMSRRGSVPWELRKLQQLARKTPFGYIAEVVSVPCRALAPMADGIPDLELVGRALHGCIGTPRDDVVERLRGMASEAREKR